MRMTNMDFHAVAEISHQDYYACLFSGLPASARGQRGPAEIQVRSCPSFAHISK